MTDPIFTANTNYNHGEEDHRYNPYKPGTLDYEAYMIQIGRRQLEDHREFNHQLEK